MNTLLSRREALALLSTAGAGLLAGCQGTELSAPPGGESGGDEEVSLGSYSRSGWDHEDDPEEHDWVHIVSDGASANLTFDARFCAALGAVEVDLRGSGGTEYELAFETDGEYGTATAADGTPSDVGCDPGDYVVGGGNVPNDWDRLAVTVDGSEVAAIERSGTTPELRPLPAPIGSS